MLNHRQIHNINGTKTASATVENVLLSRGTKAEVFLIILKLYQLLSKSCFFVRFVLVVDLLSNYLTCNINAFLDDEMS